MLSLLCSCAPALPRHLTEFEIARGAIQHGGGSPSTAVDRLNGGVKHSRMLDNELIAAKDDSIDESSANRLIHGYNQGHQSSHHSAPSAKSEAPAASEQAPSMATSSDIAPSNLVRNETLHISSSRAARAEARAVAAAEKRAAAKAKRVKAAEARKAERAAARRNGAERKAAQTEQQQQQGQPGQQHQQGQRQLQQGQQHLPRGSAPGAGPAALVTLDASAPQQQQQQQQQSAGSTFARAAAASRAQAKAARRARAEARHQRVPVTSDVAFDRLHEGMRH